MAKLMLVEDDNNLREIYQARLQAEGYDIVTAKDGEEALVVAKAEKPDLVISDVMMPKISGFEMLDILRNTEGMQAVKVIMLTALGQSDDQQRADKLGADRYLVKSQVTLEDIVKTAHTLLNDAPEAAEPVAPTAPAPAETPAPAPAVSAPPEPAPAPAPAATPAPAASAPATPAPDPVPAPAPEPAAPATPAPAPDPAPVATPQAVAAPPATPDPAPVKPSDTNDAQTTAQEEADVEASIENFVAGASSDAPSPAAAEASLTPPPASTEPAPAPAPAPATPAPDPAPAPAASATDSAANDKLVTSAADSLAAASAPADAQPVAQISKIASGTPVSAQTAPATDVEVPSGGSTADNSNNVPIAHKKVIQPIESDPKKDITTLLAVEEAKEAASAPPAPPIATIVDNEKGAETKPLTAPPAADDPNNIAL